MLELMGRHVQHRLAGDINVLELVAICLAVFELDVDFCHILLQCQNLALNSELFAAVYSCLCWGSSEIHCSLGQLIA